MKSEKKSIEKQTVGVAFAEYKKDLIEGFTIVFKSHLAKFLLGSIVANFDIGSIYAILAAFADDRGGSELYGLYLAAISGGALIGAIGASWFERYPLSKLTIVLFFLGGTTWMISGFIPMNSLSIILFCVSWIPIGATNVITGAALQSIVPQHLLRRIFSVISSLKAMAMLFGSLIGGYLSEIFSSTSEYIWSAGGILFISLVWILNKILRSLPHTSKLNPEEVGLADESVTASS
ncbi:MAG: hypothetical protein ACQEWI_00860 [Bacillota bacterium]